MGIFEELKRRNVFRVVVAYTIVAWLVAQIADLVLNNIGAPEWVMPALFLMLVLGFFAALVISWAYELTPDGIKRERDVVRDDSITHVTAKKLDYITIAAVVGVVVMFVLQQNDSGQAVTGSAANSAVSATDSARESVVPGDQSIAVLPSPIAGHGSLQLAMAYQQVGDPEKAAELLSRAVAGLADLDRTRPASLVAQELNTLAQLIALQGDKMLSIATAEEATQVVSLQGDDVDGRWHLLTLSWVLAKVGEGDRALAILAQIIGKPSGPRPWELYLDPRWDFFRDDERFNDLIRPHNLEQSSHE